MQPSSVELQPSGAAPRPHTQFGLPAAGGLLIAALLPRISDPWSYGLLLLVFVLGTFFIQLARPLPLKPRRVLPLAAPAALTIPVINLVAVSQATLPAGHWLPSSPVAAAGLVVGLSLLQMAGLVSATWYGARLGQRLHRVDDPAWDW